MFLQEGFEAGRAAIHTICSQASSIEDERAVKGEFPWMAHWYAAGGPEIQSSHFKLILPPFPQQ